MLRQHEYTLLASVSLGLFVFSPPCQPSQNPHRIPLCATLHSLAGYVPSFQHILVLNIFVVTFIFALSPFIPMLRGVFFLFVEKSFLSLLHFLFVSPTPLPSAAASRSVCRLILLDIVCYLAKAGTTTASKQILFSP